MGARWTRKEHNTLKAMATAGARAREIGEVLRKTKNAVIGRANREGVVLQHDHRG